MLEFGHFNERKIAKLKLFGGQERLIHGHSKNLLSGLLKRAGTFVLPRTLQLYCTLPYNVRSADVFGANIAA
jgi:hypothetical protein